MTRLLVVAALVLVFATSTGPATGATPEPRIALVIGNSAYKDIPLPNPANDARLMAETLAGLGFEVIQRIDADQKAMKVAIFEFGDRLEDAGKDAVGLFYYAGHGLQVGGENYLVPLGAAIKRESHVNIEAVAASWVLNIMEYAGNRMNFVILDACRNNPLTRGFRSATRGLARMNAPRGSLIAYSTGPGDVAADGDGANSPYTKALAEAMRTSGVSAEKVFKLTRDSVMSETNDTQVPWEESSLTGGDFYFNPASVAAAPTVAQPEPQPAPAPVVDTGASDRLFWESIKDGDDPAMFEAYLQEFPNGQFASLARLKRTKLEKAAKEETQTALVVPPPEAAITVEEMDATFVALKTSNLRAEPTTTSKRVGRISRDSAVPVTGMVEDGKWYRVDHEGETAYVFGTLVEEVDPDEIAAWRVIAKSSDPEVFSAFLDNYPDGHFAERAEDKLGDLNTAAGETQIAALPPPEPETPTKRRYGSARLINVQQIRDIRGQQQPILTDIVRNTLGVVPSAEVISDRPSAEDDVVVSGSILRFDQRQEPNPDYQGAQVAAQIFGALGAVMTANIPPLHTVVDVEVLISAEDKESGRSFSESGYANLKIDPRQTSMNQARFQALQEAVVQATKRIVIRLMGGTPQRGVTDDEIRGTTPISNQTFSASPASDLHDEPD